MRNYFAHYRFLTKLLLLIIPPFLVITYLTSENIVQMYGKYKSLKEVEQSIVISNEIGLLVHEIQVERGLSAGYLGSNGTKFLDQLTVQRKKVDTQFKLLKTRMSNFDQTACSPKMREACTMLDKIGLVRDKISKHSLTVNQELDIYTRIISLYLDDITFIAKASKDAIQTRQLTAYSSFLRAKERLGIIRAIGADTFSHHRFEPGMRQKLTETIAEEKIFLTLFSTYADEEALKIYKNTMKTHSFDKLTRLKKELMQSDYGDRFTADPEEWFDLISKKIEVYKQVQQSLSNYLMAYSNMQMVQMYHTLFITFLLDIVMVFAIFVLTGYLSNELFNENQEQQKILVQQSKMAAMGEMISSISHQWRQPLNAVAVLSQEIQIKYQLDALKKDELNTLSEEIQKYLEYMSKTIDDFRNFFKPTKQASFFDVVNAVESALSIVGKQLEDHGIAVDFSYLSSDDAHSHDPDAYRVEGFESEFKQVIINILNNAREAIDEYAQNTPLLRKAIHISIVRSSDELLIRIRDNGGGIKSEVIDTLFDPYISTKHEQQGTGIGLYMSKLIIERNMMGRLSVRNVDDGAEFEIALHVD